VLNKRIHHSIVEGTETLHAYRHKYIATNQTYLQHIVHHH